MRLLILESSRWTVTAAQEPDASGVHRCRFTTSMASLGPNYAKSAAGLMVMLENFSEHGRKMLNDGICHEVDENEKLFEFIKGDLRLIWFYGNGNQIIICSHCFVKKGRKTPPSEKAAAIRLKREYFSIVDKGLEVPLFSETPNT